MQRKGGANLERITVMHFSHILGKTPNYCVAVDFALIFAFDWKFHPTSFPPKSSVETSTLPWETEQPANLSVRRILASFSSDLTGFPI